MKLLSIALWPSKFFTAVRAGTSTYESWQFFNCFFGFVQRETSIWYQMICNVVFVVCWGTLLRLTAGAAVSFRNPTTLQSIPWLCASIQEESWPISSWSSTATSAVNIAYLTMGWRNCYMTEAVNSLSAAAGPELSETRNPTANLASDSATARLIRVRVCVLWRPGASVGRTQAER